MRIDDLIASDGPTCVWCGRELWPADLTAEHLLPRARGGRTIPENLAVACRACNRRRRTRSVTAYVRSELRSGRSPRTDLITRSLARLTQSSERMHADYAERELMLLGRLAAPSPVAGQG